jgi:GH25 family lysozyme M1 (1,4-beta-N-acetylmuramidase)
MFTPPDCTSWKPAIPTPAFATKRAVDLLAQGHAGTFVDQSGKAWTDAELFASGGARQGPYVYEWGSDGRLYRYGFAQHPNYGPDGVPNPALGMHLGVEAFYCADVPAPSWQPNGNGGGGTLPPPIVAQWGTGAHGFDISAPGQAGDFAAAYASGERFVFMKQPSTGLNAWKRAKAAGLLRGAYQYLGSEDGKGHAEALFNALNADLGELPPVIDLEDVTKADGTQQPATWITGPAVLSWIDRATQLWGRRPLVYTGDFWLQSRFDDVRAEVAEKSDLWRAQWNAGDGSEKRGGTPKPLAGWSQATFWQYAGDVMRGTKGMPAQVDLNWFAGDENELRAYASGAPIVTPGTTPAGGGDAATFRADCPHCGIRLVGELTDSTLVLKVAP